MKRLFTAQFDISGNSIYRVIKTGMLNKVIPVGNFKQGPGLRPACTLWVLHNFGRPLFWFGVRFERQLHYLRRILFRK